MAFEEGIRNVSRVAAADLRTAQFKIVKLDSTGKVVLTAAITDLPFGVLQNAPNTGEEATVCVYGITKIKAAASTAGALSQIGTNNAGLAAAITPGTDTTVYKVGQYLEAPGGANVIVPAAVDFLSAGRAS